MTTQQTKLLVTKNTNSLETMWQPFDSTDENHYVEYDFENRFVLVTPVKEAVPNSTFCGYRGAFKDRRPDGKLQELMVRTCELYSYGPKPTYDQVSKALAGYQMSFPLYNSEGPSERMKYHIEFMEKKFIPFIRQKIVDLGGPAFGMDELSYSDTKKIRAFTRSKNKDTQLVDPNAVPHLSCKLFSKKPTHDRISTPFYYAGFIDASGSAVRFPDPLVFVGQGVNATPLVWFTGIYKNANGMTIQYKLSEVDVSPANGGQKRRAPIAPDAQVIGSDVAPEKDFGLAKDPPAVPAPLPSYASSQQSTEFVAISDDIHPMGGVGVSAGVNLGGVGVGVSAGVNLGGGERVVQVSRPN